MAGKADGRNRVVAPTGLGRQSPGAGSIAAPVPRFPTTRKSVRQFPCLEDPQLRGPWRVGVGSRDALAGGIVLVTMEGTNKPAGTYAPTCRRPEIGAQVHALGLGNADTPDFVTPRDDFFTHPRLPNKLGLPQGLAARDEVPTLRKRGRQRVVRGLPTSSCHR